MNWPDFTTRRQPMPAYRLVVDGQDVTARFRGPLISLTLTDKRGLEADQLDIELDDSDGLLAIPRKGAEISCAIGWAGQALVDKGLFTVDEVEHSGSPDRLTIRASSADLRGGLCVKREASWHNTTLGKLVITIAKRHGLTPAVATELDKVAIKHLDQTSESDLNLITRVAKEHGAIATIKEGRLLVFPAGRANTVSGMSIAPAFVARADGDQHRYGSSDRDAYSGVMAYWLEPRTGKKREVVAGGEDNLKTLRYTYASEADAMRAAVAEMGRIQRATASLKLTLAMGRPELYPETPLIASGWKPEINEAAWLVVEVVHQISDSGYTSDIVSEVFGAETDFKPGAGVITGVRARWLDKKTGKRSSVLVGKEGNVKTLPHVYVSEKNARAAAQREWAGR